MRFINETRHYHDNDTEFKGEVAHYELHDEDGTELLESNSKEDVESFFSDLDFRGFKYQRTTNLICAID